MHSEGQGGRPRKDDTCTTTAGTTATTTTTITTLVPHPAVRNQGWRCRNHTNAARDNGRTRAKTCQPSSPSSSGAAHHTTHVRVGGPVTGPPRSPVHRG